MSLHWKAPGGPREPIALVDIGYAERAGDDLPYVVRGGVQNEHSTMLAVPTVVLAWTTPEGAILDVHVQRSEVPGDPTRQELEPHGDGFADFLVVREDPNWELGGLPLTVWATGANR